MNFRSNTAYLLCGQYNQRKSFNFSIYPVDSAGLHGRSFEIAVDPFLTQGKEIYYIYMSTGESLFVTQDEIIIKEII